MNQEIEFSNKFMTQAEQYMHQLGIPFVEKYLETWDNMRLERFTSLLKVSGALEGYFMLSVDAGLVGTLVNQFLLEKLSEHEIILYADDVIAEIANTIAGNALMDRDEVDIVIHVPIIYRAGEISFKPNAQLKSAFTKMGSFQCAYLRSDEICLDL
jgi:CheY-specific phosphatase CheX